MQPKKGWIFIEKWKDKRFFSLTKEGGSIINIFIDYVGHNGHCVLQNLKIKYINSSLIRLTAIVPYEIFFYVELISDLSNTSFQKLNWLVKNLIFPMKYANSFTVRCYEYEFSVSC